MFDFRSCLKRACTGVFLAMVAVPGAIAQPPEYLVNGTQLVSGSSLANPGAVRAPRGSRKVGPDLLALQAEFEAHRSAGAPAGTYRNANPAIRVADGFVLVDTAASEDASALQADLKRIGMVKPEIYGRMVSGRLPIVSIDALESLDSLRLARPAYAMTHAGTVTSQGDAAVNADEARLLFGIDGTGITIGTLSDSYDCLGGAAGDVTANDLPAGVLVQDDIDDCSGAIDEGRAMMQLIHDLAPGSSQAFHSAFNGGQAGFAQGIIDLANAGSDVIVDDVIYFAEPMFQDGIVAQAVDTVVGQGVPYFSSAGNSGRNSYQSEFRPSGQEPLGAGQGEAHDFDPGPGPDIYQNVTVPAGRTLLVTLQWDSPFFSVSGAPGSPNDIDIFLVDEPPTTVLAQSISDNVGGDAVEVLSYTNPEGGSTSFNILVQRFSGDAPGLIKYVIFRGGTIEEFDTNSSTVYGHANAAGAVAVGAAAYFDTPEFGQSPPLLESFSSAGPTPILFDTAGNPVSISRQKPEITCVDGTNTTFFGSDVEPDGFPNFFGTSAAAPHAAAIAGLMLNLESALTPAEILDALEASAIDMGVPGVDDDSGAGFCQADQAVAAVANDTISVTNVPSPVSVDEPGGSSTFTARIDNTGNVDVDLAGLDDDVYGDLNGQGSCSLPQSIAPGDFYQCAYSASVSGNAGNTQVSTTTASGSSVVGLVSGEGMASVTIADVLPSISVTKSVSSTSLAEPGDEALFTVRITNVSLESADLVALNDDVHGNLNGQGDCSVPQAIIGGDFYECSYIALVTGNAGDTAISTVTATAADDEGNSTQQSASAEVTITDVLPSISVTYTASPIEVEAPGGTVSYIVQVENNSAAEAAFLTSLVDSEFGDLDGVGTCSIPQNLAAGAGFQCDFDTQVNGAAGTSQVNTVTVVAEDDDGNSVGGDDQASVSIVEPPRADLVIGISDSVDPLRQDQTLIYTVTVVNNGPIDAENVVVTNTVPGSLTLNATTGCNEDPAGAPTCTLGTLANGDSRQIVISTTTDSQFFGEITFVSSVASSTNEANPGDEDASEITEILNPDTLFKDGYETR